MIVSLLKKSIKPAIHFLVLLSYLVSFVVPVNVAHAHNDGLSGAAIPAPPVPIVKDLPAPISLTPAEMQDFGKVVPDHSHGLGPLMDKAPNGVLLELIRKPNGRGISHNQLEEMDVGARGLILNNSTEKNARSQLGGEIIGNHLLQGQNARIIIQEVTGRNTSQIRGYIEVHGKAAELIIVNPNGIDVNGAGFINIPRATLSTGQLEALSNGQPIQLKVDGGEITIQGKGLNLQGVSQFDIVTRKVNLDGKLYGAEDNTDVSISAGKQIYDHASRTSQAHGAPEAHAEPVYAIDSSTLGGMYAGKIALISTEKGVGVRAPENMASCMSDVTILANGDVVLKNASAAKKLDVKTTNGSVTVEKDKIVHGTEGVRLEASDNIEISENAIVKAGTSVDLKAQALKNQGKILAGEKISGQLDRLENHGSMISQGDMDVSAKSITNHGKIKAGQKLLLKGFDQLENKRHANIESKGMLLLNGQNLSNHGTMLSQSLMDIRLSEDMLNDGWIRSYRGLKVFLNGHFLNTYQGDHIGGDMLITGPLLIRGKDGQKARHIENRSASIETLGPDGHISFKGNLVQNKMAVHDFKTIESPVNETGHGDKTRTGYKIVEDILISKDNPAYLFTSGAIDIEADQTTNEMSFITAAKSIIINGKELKTEGRILRNERIPVGRNRNGKGQKTTDWSPTKEPSIVTIIDSQSLASWIHAGEKFTANVENEYNQNAGYDKDHKDNVAYIASNRNESPEMIADPSDFAFQASESPFFRINTGAEARYLIEGRKKYVNAGSMMGSDYFLSRMGLGNAKRYGDAFVETRFLRKQIFENGLADRLGQVGGEAELMRQLYDNAIEEAKDLELYPGIKMTAELISQLKRDIIWMEKEIVGGEEVLVPRLYVARSTRAAQLINNGITAKNIHLKAGTVIAQGAILSQGKTHIEAQKSALFVGAQADGKETKITAGETVFNLSSALAGDSLAVKGQNIYSETLTKTTEGKHSSMTQAQGQASFTSRAAPLTLESGKEGSQQYHGTNLHGAQGVQFKSEGAPVYLGSVETGSHVAINSRKHKHNEHHTHHVKSKVTTEAGHDVTYDTGSLTFRGVDHHAGGNIVAKVDGTFENTPVHDYDYVQKSSKSKGSFGRKKSKDSTHMSDQVNRNVLTADGGTVSIISKEDNHNVAPEIHAHVGAELRSTEGKVILKSDTSTEQHVKNKSGSNFAWQKTAGNGKSDETVEEPIMDTPNLVTEGALGTELSLKARGNLEQTLAALSADPNMAWAAELAKDPSVQVHLLKEYHKHWDYKQSGLTPEFSLAVAAALALAGGVLFAPAAAGAGAAAGAAGAGAAAGGTAVAGGAAATTSAVTLSSVGTAAATAVGKAAMTSAIISGINNKGDPRLVVKDMTSKNQMKSLAMTAITAGAVQGVSGTLNVPQSTTSVAARAQNVAIQRGVNVVVSTTIGGESVQDSLKSNAIAGAVDFGAGLAAQKIGEAYHGNPEEISLSEEAGSEQSSRIDYVTHKLAHGIVGGVAGGILGGSKGAIGGATGAIVSEVVAEEMRSGAQKEAFKNVIKEEASLGRPLTQAEFEHAFHNGLTDQFSYIEDMAKLSAASVALLGGADVHASVYAAGNATENNFFILGIFAPEAVAASGLAITVGKISWEIYALTHEEELEQTREEVCQYVGEKLDIEADTVALVYDGIMMGASVASAAKQGGKALLRKFGKDAVHTGVSTVKSGSDSPASHGNADGKIVELNSRVDTGDKSPRIGFKGRDYIRDMESRSGIKIQGEQRSILKNSLQEKEFKKLGPEEKKIHGALFKNEKFKSGLKGDWEKNTGQKWPGEMRFNPKTNKVEHYPDQLHHIIPQDVGGPHEWWNAHPLKSGAPHQGGVHGKNSPLRQIMKEVK